MDRFDYCLGRCNKKKQCQYAEMCCLEKIEVTINDDLPDRVYTIGFLTDTEKCMRDDKPIGTLKIDGNNWELEMTDLSKEIQIKAQVIAELLKQGKHVELCENKDGLRIIAMDRKVVK